MIVYLFYGLFTIAAIMHIYYKLKVYSLRQDLRDDPEPVVFFVPPWVSWGFVNEFPENEEYSRLYQRYRYSLIGALVVVVSGVLLFWIMYLP